MPSNSIIGVLFVLNLIYISISYANFEESIETSNYLYKELSTSDESTSNIFNVMSYGAIPDGKTVNNKAFQNAWNDACQRNGRNIMLIPKGTYMLHYIRFTGKCKSDIRVVIKGVLKAPTSPSLFGDTWIGFKNIEGLSVYGGGVLDGQGASGWPHNDCKSNHNCVPLPVSLRFDFVNRSTVNNIQLINSKRVHLNIFACDNMNVSGITITAPGDSPNTDGIHIGSSTNIRISKSVIQTGDDCVSMVTGSRNIRITGVHCGPGHGISIGSLGNNIRKEFVTDVTVRNCTFVSTQNGLRIKTRPSPYPSFISNIVFSDIKMVNVNNPIIIDQHYCPFSPCSTQGNAGVKVHDVTFKNVKGTSSSKVAVILNCSESNPCQNVKLINIDLAYKGRGGGPPTSMCKNVKGITEGKQSPVGCLR